MRAVIYTRVSTEEQAKEGFSLDAQREKCRKYVELNEWDFVGEYKDDGYSAKDLNRPAMQKLLRDVEKKAFDLIIIYRLDRMVRSVPDLHNLIERFDQNGVKFVSVTEHFDTTTATGRLFINIIAALAQWERENLSERVKMGMEQKILKGDRIGSHPPYGYDFDENYNLIVNSVEARILQRIYNEYLTTGVHGIAIQLNKESIRTKQGKTWTDAAIAYIVSNPTYIGKNRWKYRSMVNGKRMVTKDDIITSDASHEPIITEDLFEEVQQVRSMRQEFAKSNSAKSVTSDFIFSSMIVCTRCGSKLHGNRFKNKEDIGYTYRCPNKHKYKTCDLKIIREEVVEAEFLKYLDGIFLSGDIDKFRPPSKAMPIKQDSVMKQIEQIKEMRRKWQIGFAQDLITIEELQSLVEESRIREKQLVEISKTEKANSQPLSQDNFVSALKDMKKMWSNLNRKEKKQLAITLVKTIVIDVQPTEVSGEKNKCSIEQIIFN
jgi:site-specific DNA recombinase